MLKYCVLFIIGAIPKPLVIYSFEWKLYLKISCCSHLCIWCSRGVSRWSFDAKIRVFRFLKWLEICDNFLWSQFNLPIFNRKICCSWRRLVANIVSFIVVFACTCCCKLIVTFMCSVSWSWIYYVAHRVLLDQIASS